MTSKIKKLKWFSLSLLALLLVYIAVNQIDRPLNPNLSKLLGKNYPAPPDDKNAYYDYVGFYSAAGMDVHKTGEAVIDAYKKSRNRAEFNIKSIPKAGSLEIDNEDGFPCRNFTVQTGYCLQDYRQHDAKYALYLAKNQLAIDRYKSLLESRHFFATTFYILRTPFTVQPLYLAQVGRSWLQGEKARSITLLTADIRFQRMILADSDLLIYQMISVAALYRDYALLSEMIRQCAACVARHPQINAVLSNLSDEELLMARVMQRELIFSHFHDKLDDNSDLSRYRIYMNHFYPDLLNVGAEKNRLLGLLGYLYLENDTNNHYFEKWKRYIDLGKLKGREFAKRYDEINKINSFYNFAWYDYLYNPGGKYFLAHNDTGKLLYRPEHYLAAKFELDCKIRLTRILLKYKNRRVHMDGMSGYLSSLGMDDHNPFTTLPVNFNDQNMTIYIRNVDGVKVIVELKHSNDGKT